MTDYQITYQGLTVGAGTVWPIAQVSGLEDLPPIRSGDQARAYAHGEVPGLDLAAGRNIVLDLLVFDSGTGDFAANVERLKAITVPQGTETELVFTLPGRNPRALMCRPRRRQLPIDLEYSFRYGHASIELHATDPRIYDESSTSATIGLPSASSGLTFPATAPFVFGSTGTGGTAVFTNAGNFPAPWVAQIAGPVVNPVITLQATGQAVTLNGSIATGETVTIDSLSRSVLLNGTASRYSWVAAGTTWWDAPVGAYTVQFGAASGSGTCSFFNRSCWL